MPYQEKILPLIQEASSSGSLGQMWKISEELLVGVFGTPRLWELTGIRDLPTTCNFTMRPLRESDVEQLRTVTELAPLMNTLDQLGYFGPSGMIRIELGTRVTGSCRIMDVVLHLVRGLTDGDIGLSLVCDGGSQHLLQQASFVQGCGVEDSVTMRAGRALEASLIGVDQSAVIPFPRLIEIFSLS